MRIPHFFSNFKYIEDGKEDDLRSCKGLKSVLKTIFDCFRTVQFSKEHVLCSPAIKKDEKMLSILFPIVTSVKLLGFFAQNVTQLIYFFCIHV